LRQAPGEVENGAVRAAKLLTTLGTAILCGSLAGPAGAAAKAPGMALKAHVAPPAEARVDINHASIDELMKIPGMSRSWAGRIVRFRPYRSKLDLVNRGVVTSQVYDRIKDDVIAHRAKR